MSEGWKAKLALAVAVAAAVAYSLTRPQGMHASLDAGFGRRCPSCQVAAGQEHLDHCEQPRRGSRRPPADGKAHDQKRPPT